MKAYSYYNLEWNEKARLFWSIWPCSTMLCDTLDLRILMGYDKI